MSAHEQKSQDELRRMRRMSLIKMAAMAGIVGLFLAFGSIAWFTQSREVEGEGVQMAASGANYTLSMVFDPEVDPAANGLYYADYHSQVIDTDAVVWTMSDTVIRNHEQSFGNYTQREEDGICPGSHGCLSFIITPKVDGDLPLRFNFELLGYNAETDENTSEISMAPLDAVEDADVIDYLKGHIMFFENYDPETGKYSGPILLNNGVMNRTFHGNNTAERVDIYWVWPLTLSMLVKPDSDTETVPLCSGSEYTSLENYVVNNPQYFMKGITTSQANPLTATIIKNDYPLYGGHYDQADNIIGARVRFLRLIMTIE